LEVGAFRMRGKGGGAGVSSARIATMGGFRAVVLLAVLSLPVQVAAAASRADTLAIPEALKDWVGWVLHGQEQKTCPYLYNRFELIRCAWPGELDLALDGSGGTFTQHWQILAAGWITLPGDGKRWPQNVTLDGAPAALSTRGGRPSLYLQPGRYRIGGEFRWTALPESLPVPRESGLVRLNLGGRSVAFPDLDDQGNLWFREREAAADRGPETGNRLKLQVFRRVVDDVPLELVTRIDLEVSGTQREELLAGALSEGFVPLRLDSPLPARLEPDGRLRVQVRPGRWTIEFAARHPAPVQSLQLQQWPAPWPTEEIWVFDARNHLRLVEIGGPAAVDPRQTGLPQEWHALPAWAMQPGSTMRFNVIRRGDPEPEPDSLTLQRRIWLDFDGGGYTIQDSIGGTMTRGWRLEADAPLEPGRVSLGGEPQFITTLGDGGRRGVEVRRGQVELSADSRHESGIATLPATGWNHDFHSVGATLHLPPGWTLLSARGVDEVPGTWLQRWTLLDIFLVLIAALAVRGLWGWRYGLLALAALALIWHEPGAPRIVWLHVLAAIALLRVLPPGRFAALVTAYRNLALLALVVITVPFMVNAVRVGLYPQLGGTEPPVRPFEYPATAVLQEVVPMDAPGVAADVLSGKRDARTLDRMFEKRMSAEEIVVTAARRLDEIDPDARVQTGPGLPDWQWREIPLRWNGPVQRDQQISLLFLSPAANLFLNILRVLLVAALALLMFGIRSARLPGSGAGGARAAAALLLLPLLLPSGNTHAAGAIPDPQLLEELKARLLAPPECLPECAQVPRLRFDLEPEMLTVRVEVHALDDVYVPLPAQTGMWFPSAVSVNGAPARALSRSDDGTLWANLGKGVHQVVLAGAMPPGNTVQLPLPLVPRRVDFSAEGWSVDGIADGMPTGRQILLTRQRRDEAQAEIQPLAAAELPPFVRIERTLHLGLEWSVETRVVRASPPGPAIVIQVPLLAGESVTTDGVRSENGAVAVNMGPRDKAFTWQSSLEISETMTLTAAETGAWTEIWRVDVSPIWHATPSGIAVIHHQDRGGRWLPEWRPWPSESITLRIERPAGVPGPTLTVDRATLRTAPGSRASDTTLEMILRSSQGGQHGISLPEQAQLLSVTIDGIAQPIRQEGRTITLPLSPATQWIELAFREPDGIGMLFRSPAVDLGVPSVNSRIHLAPGADRWVLFTAGPRLGPAVLFWGVLLVVILLSAGLGRIDLTPLRMHHWLLLGVGLTQTSIWVAVIVVGWLLALGARTRLPEATGRIRFNFIQVGLVFLTVAALIMLFHAVRHGLLGLPEMQIGGNGSTAQSLNWYQDRSAAELPRARVYSVPLWFYRALMLAWALWLAFALLGWLKWGWGCFSRGGYWKARPKIEKPAQG
jgi:hypothetical protein